MPDPDLGLLFRGIVPYADDAAFQAAVPAGTSPWNPDDFLLTAGGLSLDTSLLYGGLPTLKFQARENIDGDGFVYGTLGSSPARRWMIEAIRFSPTFATSAIADGIVINVGAELSNTWDDYDRWSDIQLTFAAPDQFAGQMIVDGTSEAVEPAPAFSRTMATLRGQWIVLARLLEYTSGAGTLRVRAFANAVPIIDVTKAEADLGPLAGMGNLVNVYVHASEDLWKNSGDRTIDPTNDYLHYGRCDVYDADVNPDPAGVLGIASGGVTSGKGKRRYWVEVQRDRDGNVIGFVTNSPVF